MRVLVITPSYPISEDKVIGTWAHKQAMALQRQGYSIDVISPIPWIPPLPLENERLEKWADVERTKELDNVSVYYPRCPVYPIDLLNEYFYDPIPQIPNFLTWIFTRSTITGLIEQHDYNGVLCHNPIPAGYVGRQLKRREGIPYVLVFHSHADLDSLEKYPFAKQAYKKGIEGAKNIVSVSKKMKNRIQTYFSTDVTVVQNGYDKQEVEAARKRGKNTSDKTLLLSVGSFVERKGHIYLLKAISDLKYKGVITPDEFECLLVGSGPKESRLRAYVADAELDNMVTFRSNIPRDELNDVMREATIFALPSWDEPFGVVYAEVMPFGTPVVLCKDEGFSELIEHNVNGVLVEPKDVESLSENLRRLLIDDEFRERIGQNGRQLAEDRLSWERNAKEIGRLFDVE